MNPVLSLPFRLRPATFRLALMALAMSSGLAAASPGTVNAAYGPIATAGGSLAPCAQTHVSVEEWSPPNDYLLQFLVRYGGLSVSDATRFVQERILKPKSHSRLIRRAIEAPRQGRAGTGPGMTPI